MGILIYNFTWMLINVFLALVPVVLTKIILQCKNKNLIILFYILWFIFLPNSIYLVTDLQYFPADYIRTTGIPLLFLIGEYATLALCGIVTYFYSMKPLELLIKKIKKSQRTKIIILVNYIIAFAVILGKIQRTESWYLLTNPARVIHDSFATLFSPVLLIGFIFAGLLINLLYFGVKKFQLRES